MSRDICLLVSRRPGTFSKVSRDVLSRSPGIKSRDISSRAQVYKQLLRLRVGQDSVAFWDFEGCPGGVPNWKDLQESDLTNPAAGFDVEPKGLDRYLEVFFRLLPRPYMRKIRALLLKPVFIVVTEMIYVLYVYMAAEKLL